MFSTTLNRNRVDTTTNPRERHGPANMSLLMSPRELDQLIYGFRSNPTKETYETVIEWYNQHSQLDDYPDPEHITCIYIFLLTANLRYMFTPITRDDITAGVAQLRDFIQGVEPIFRGRRKSYMDCATAKFNN